VKDAVKEWLNGLAAEAYKNSSHAITSAWMLVATM
jgi:hypothetical protein